MVSPRTHLVWGGLLVLAVCLALRIHAVLKTDVVQRDGVMFILYAKALCENPAAAIARFDQHAGYPALVATIQGFLSRLGLIGTGVEGGVEGWERAGQWVSVVNGTLATMGVWALAGLTVGWRPAWVGGLMFAVGRKWMSLGADVMSDASYLAPFIWALVLAVLIVKKMGPPGRWKVGLSLSLAVGALGGLSYWVRPEGLGAIFVALLLLATWAALGRLSWPKATASGAVIVLVAALVASPYMYAIGGLTKKKKVFAASSAAMSWVAPTPLPLAMMMPLALGPASDRPGPRALLDQTVEAQQPVVFGLTCIWVCVTAIHFSIPKRWRKSYLPLPKGPGAVVCGLVFVLYSAVALWLHAHAGYLDWRHCMPVAFSMVPLAGAGLVVVVDFFAHLASPLRLKQLTIEQFILCQWCWVIPVVAMAAGYQSLAPLHGGKNYVKDAARALRNSVKPGDFSVANVNWIIHYAQVPGLKIDTTTLDVPALESRLAQVNPKPRWFVLSERWLASQHADIESTLLPPRFELIARFEQKPVRGDEADVIYLYRLRWDEDGIGGNRDGVGGVSVPSTRAQSDEGLHGGGR